MPYEIRRVKRKYCVFKVGGGRSLGCHHSRREARAQIAAIEASEARKEHDADRRLMLLVTSNAYKDREQEIVSEAALTAHVDRAWKDGNFAGRNVLLWWHDGDPIGDIVFADMIGPFLVEVARELPDGPVDLAARDDEPVPSTVKAVWDALATAKDLGASHSFFHADGDEADGVYEEILKVETSVLPREAAANTLTYVEVIGANHD